MNTTRRITPIRRSISPVTARLTRNTVNIPVLEALPSAFAPISINSYTVPNSFEEVTLVNAQRPLTPKFRTRLVRKQGSRALTRKRKNRKVSRRRR